MNRRWVTASAFLIFLAGALLRAQDFMKPWGGGHNGWGGAMYGGIARNFIRYGYLATEFGPVTNGGRVAPGAFQYYYHYPPLLIWLVSASFQVFGVHEWSARIVPLLFSVASMILIYLFAKRLFSAEVAVLALLFSAVTPIEAYYGMHVDVYNSVAVFFTLLAVHGYARWAEDSRARHLAMCIAGVFFGCMTSWFTFFVVPLIVIHHLLIRPDRKSAPDRRIWLLPAAAVAVFALFMLHRRILMSGGKTEIMGSLLDKLKIRTSMATPAGRYAIAGVAFQHARDMAHLYSVPLILLAATWVALFAKHTLERRLQTRDWLVLMLFGYGFLHNLVFPSLLLGHDYMLTCYAPAIALGAAIAASRLAGMSAEVWGAQTRRAVIGSLALICVAFALLATRHVFALDSDYADYSPNVKRWGGTIQAHSRDTDVVLTCTPEDKVLEYYVDRALKYSVQTQQQLDSSQKTLLANLYVCPQSQMEQNPIMLKYMNAAHPRRTDGGLIFYSLTQ